MTPPNNRGAATTVAGASHPTTPSKLKFTASDRFLRELRRRADAYFERTGRPRRDCPQMYFKTATILLWFFSAYFLLLFAVHSWYLIVPLAMVLGLAMAAIGFNIQHDGGHKAWIRWSDSGEDDIVPGSQVER